MQYFQKRFAVFCGNFFYFVINNQSMLKRERPAHILYGINPIKGVLPCIRCQEIQLSEDAVCSDLQEGKVMMNFTSGSLSLSFGQLFCALKSVSSFQQKASFKEKAVSLYSSVLALARAFLPQLKATFIRAFDVKHGKPDGDWNLTQKDIIESYQKVIIRDNE